MTPPGGSAPRRVVTEADIRRAARSGSPVVVGPRDLVTAAARDAAAAMQVSIETAPPPTAPPGPSEDADRVVAIGADHGGTAMKLALVPVLERLRWQPLDLGSHGDEPVDYPVFAARVADAVAEGRAAAGIVVDGAGIGSAMVANKIRGVRAAMCYDVTTARNAREHNHANVLTLGGTLVGQRLAAEIVTAFLETPFGGGRHARRVALIDALDRAREFPALLDNAAHPE